MRALLLGTTQLLRADGSAVDVAGRLRECFLLGALADARSTNLALLRREDVVALLWPGASYDPRDRSLENVLYQAIHQLRQQIGASYVETVPGVGYRLALEPAEAEPLSVDLLDFRNSAADSTRPALASALGLVRGDFLDEIPDLRRYSQVVEPRLRIRGEYVAAAQALTGWQPANVRTIVDNFVGEPRGTLLDAINGTDPDNLPDGEISERPQWSAFARKQLAPGGTRSLRITLTGPLFLHTDSYYERLNRDPAGPHMESELRDFIFRRAGRKAPDIRLMLRCTDSYFASVAAHVPPDRREAFTDLVLDQIDALWGDADKIGPELCCYNTGISDICAVFDDAVVVSWRTAETKEMGYPMTVNHRPEVISARQRRFDETFADNGEGQRREVEKLRDFVSEIPHRAAHFPYLH
jgi:DNA-binding winged helix-turn-helix (wHTH) protein